MNELNLNNENCQKCPALCKSRKQVVNGIGPLDSTILLIAEAPGPTEDQEGTPLIGPAGKTLNQMLAKAGIDRNKIRIVNSVRCFPRNEDKSVLASFRQPTPEEIEACSEYLEVEIKTINPNVIVPVGNVALSAVLGEKRALASTKITKVRGTEIWSERFNCKIMPTFHPSAVMRSPNLEATVVQDFVRIRESSQYKELTKGDKGNYITLDTIEKVDAFFERMKEVPNFVFDLETSSLDWQTGHILAMSVSWKEKTAVVLPITKYVGISYQEIEIRRRKSKKKVDEKVQVVEIEKQVIVDKVRDTYEPYWKEKQEYVLSKLKELMKSEKKTITHNGRFDKKWFMQLGWNVTPIYFDTLLAAHLINENNKGMLGLKSLALSYTSMGDYSRPLENWFKEHKIAESKRNYAYLPEDMLYAYAGMDADATYRLYKIFEQKLVAEGLDSIFFRLTMPLNENLTQTEFEGIKIDINYLHTFKKELETNISELEKRIKDVTGEINLNSPDQLKKLLFKDLKLPKIKKTKGGGDSTDVEVLEILAEMNPIPQLILEYRKLQKLYNTYVIGIEELLDKNNRIHTNFNQALTETGRLSSNSPNLQNLPSEDMRPKNQFVAEDGNIFLSRDMSQIEFRYWGIYSGDPQLVVDLLDGLDVHRNTAALANKIPVSEVTDKQRKIAKSIVFGLMYNMGTEKLSKEHNVTLEYAEHVKKTFFGRYPIAKQWKYHIVKEGRINGYVKSIFGRIRHLVGINSTDEKVRYEYEQATGNSLIQGAASDHTCDAANRILLKYKELGLHGKLRILIHDDILMEVPKDVAELSMQIMKQEMETPILGITVPIKSEGKWGTRWGSMEKYIDKEDLQKGASTCGG